MQSKVTLRREALQTCTAKQKAWGNYTHASDTTLQTCTAKQKAWGNYTQASDTSVHTCTCVLVGGGRGSG